MPENLQYSSKADEIRERAEEIEAWADELESTSNEIEAEDRDDDEDQDALLERCKTLAEDACGNLPV